MRRDKRRNAEIKEIEKYRNEEMHAATQKFKRTRAETGVETEREGERYIEIEFQLSWCLYIHA